MADDPEIERVNLELLHRADTLLNRYRAPGAAAEIPVLTQVIGSTVAAPIETIPTLTDRISSPDVLPAAPSAMEYGLRELLMRHFAAQFAAGFPPETAAALDLAAGKIAAQLSVQLDVAVRAAVEEALERLALPSAAAGEAGIMRALPDSPPPKK